MSCISGDGSRQNEGTVHLRELTELFGWNIKRENCLVLEWILQLT